MGYGMDQLPKKVASLVKKLAKLQQEKIAYIHYFATLQSYNYL